MKRPKFGLWRFLLTTDNLLHDLCLIWSTWLTGTGHKGVWAHHVRGHLHFKGSNSLSYTLHRHAIAHFLIISDHHKAEQDLLTVATETRQTVVLR